MRIGPLSFGFSNQKAGNATPPAAPRPAAKPKRKARTPAENDDVEEIRERFKAASAARRPIEAEWVLNGLCFEGKAYYKWDEQTHRAMDLRVDGEHSRYVFHNLTRPLVNKVAGLATMTQPDGNFVPDTDAEIDVQAAEEARCAAADILRYNGGRQKITLASVISSIVYGIAWEMPYWGENLKADIPKFGSDGSIIGKSSAPVGMVKIETLSPFQVYIDPSAKTWDKARYVIIAATVTLDELRERFGKDATDGVKADTRDTTSDYTEGYLPGASNDSGSWFGSGSSWSGNAQNKAVLTLTYFQKAGECEDWDDDESGEKTTDYPNGRYVVVAGDKRVYDGPLPFGDGRLPLARCVFQESLTHPYGFGLVGDLRGPQMEYNRMRTKLVNQAEDAKNTLLVPFTAEIGADAYEDGMEEHRTWRRVHYNNLEGLPPTWQPAPPVATDIYNIMTTGRENSQDIAGVHDVSNGSTPPGVTAGISIELLQQGDRSQISLFTGNLEQLTVDRNTLVVQCFAANASGSLPRLIGVDDSGNPQTAAKRAMSFKALTGGGSVSVHVEPGSATPKSPAGQKQELFDLINLNLLDPANPQALPGLLALGKTQADPMVQRLMRGIEELKAQQQAEAQAQQQMAAQQAQGANQPPPPDNSLEIEKMKQQGLAQKQQTDLQGKAQEAAIKLHTQTTLADQQHTNNLREMVTGAALKAQETKLHAQLQPPPAPNFTKRPAASAE